LDSSGSKYGLMVGSCEQSILPASTENLSFL